MLENIQIEICAGSVSDALTASSFHAVDRIELNSSLELGGITPSSASFKETRRLSDKKILCMVRPRPAGFVYNEIEKETMRQDAIAFLEENADGIVFGCLNPDLTIDTEFTKSMTKMIHSFGKEAVFHKAFDETPDPNDACRTLIECGIDRILTSGQKPSTAEGMSLICTLQKEFGDRIQILPGGGITEENVTEILRTTGCTQVHMTAKSSFEDCGTYFAVDENKIRRVLNTLQYAMSENLRQFTREDDAMLKNDRYENSR